MTRVEVAQFEALKSSLQAFPDLPVTTEDYELAAEFLNSLRRRGIQGSNVDFLICAVAHNNDLSILTTDGDFEFFAQHIPIDLYRI